MYTLYVANKNYSSWSLRPWVLMRELAIPFAENLVPFSETSSWAAFRRFSPSGKVPCLHDGELSVWDSMAIAEYLAERHAGVWAAALPARAWSRSAAAEMHAGFSVLRQVCGMNCGLRIRLGNITESLAQDISRMDELWNDGLSRFGGPFLAGNQFTAVDAFFAPVAFRAQTYGLKLSASALAYARRLLSLESMRSWESAALQEPWRVAGHEEEARRAGTVLEDLRRK